jgi:hypothetical protein
MAGRYQLYQKDQYLAVRYVGARCNVPLRLLSLNRLALTRL